MNSLYYCSVHFPHIISISLFAVLQIIYCTRFMVTSRYHIHTIINQGSIVSAPSSLILIVRSNNEQVIPATWKTLIISFGFHVD